VDVVLSASAPHAPALRALADGQPQVTLHSSLPTLAPLMARADLAIGAGGTSSWERLCLGLPTMVVTLADNQLAITEELQRRGLMQWLGHVDAVQETAIAAALQSMLAAPIDPAWSQRCRAAVDGRGTARVANILLHGVGDARQARHATPGDETLLLEWANDRLTRSTAFSPEPIPLATHQAWLARRLRDIDNCRLYIVQTGSGEPMGQVRFERVPGSTGEWEVHYALGPLFRGRQLGLCLLRDALAAHAAEFPGDGVLGRVKKDNKPSRNIFERLDFASQPSDDPAILHFHRVL
jgi:RimJ/RimL family protein N-acetyltransferase